MSCNNPMTDYSPDLPEMGDDEGKERLNSERTNFFISYKVRDFFADSSRSIEDGEIFDTPLKDMKVYEGSMKNRIQLILYIDHPVLELHNFCILKLRSGEKGSEDGRIQRRIYERIMTMVSRREVR